MSDLFLIPGGAEDYLIPKTYSAAALSVEINPPNRRANWYRAGYLSIYVPVGTKWVRSATKSIPLSWEQIIEVPYQTYRLSYTPAEWLDSPNFVVTQYPIQYNCEERCP